MSFAHVKANALALAQPLVAHLELTYRCNWRCVFCYNPRHSDLQPLVLDEWLVLLDDLRSLGTLTVCLTGGEPLAHPSFFEIARGARERGFALRIFTNGALIRTADIAQRLAALRPLSVELSLHGASAATHDQATARAGSFDAMMHALDLLQEAGARLLLKSPITRLNEDELDAMIELAERRGIRYQIDSTITPRDDGDPSPLQYAPSPSGLRKALEIGIRTGTLEQPQRERGGFNCGVGRLTVAVDPEGNVYPCLQWRQRALGNVRQTRLRAMWEGSDVRREAADVARMANDMLVEKGAVLSSASFCPALAAQRTGDPLEPDATFVAKAEAAAAIRHGLGLE